MSRACVETLEGRQLLSASPLAAKVPIPSALGDFIGQTIFSSGKTDTLSLNVTSQRGANIKGTATLITEGFTGAFSGSITKKGVVHLHAKGAAKFTANVTAHLAGDTLGGSIKATSGKTRLSGSFTSSRKLGFPPSGPVVLDLKGKPLPATYTQYSTTFTATGSSSVIAFVFRHDPGWFAFDDATVSTGAGPNLLTNGGFESGTSAGWTIFSQTSVSSTGKVGHLGSSVGGNPWNPPVFNGNYDWLEGTDAGYDGISQTISTVAGTTYTITFELVQHVTQNVTATTFQQVSTNGGTGVQGNGVDALVYAGATAPSTDPNSTLSNTN
jgi:hypothetical protein